jgi:hypothetical protein
LFTGRVSRVREASITYLLPDSSDPLTAGISDMLGVGELIETVGSVVVEDAE